MNTDTTEAIELKTYSLRRSGLPPLKFTGNRIAKTSNEIQHGNRASRWGEVTIYRTRGGRIIVRHVTRTCWQGESDHYSATSCATAAEAIAWLREGEEGLSRLAQEAVEQAAQADPEFAAAWAETVD